MPIPQSTPGPSADEIRDLITFLAANVAVSKHDGDHQKAQGYQKMLDTVEALKAAAQPVVTVASTTAGLGALEEGRCYVLPELTRVTLVDQQGVTFERYGIYPAGTGGAELMVQDQGRTVKLWPAR